MRRSNVLSSSSAGTSSILPLVGHRRGLGRRALHSGVARGHLEGKLGTTKVAYVHAAKSMIASGLNPACANGLQWKLTGKFSGKSFSGTVAITLPDGGHATSTISLTRS